MLNLPPCPVLCLYLEFDKILIFVWGTDKSLSWRKALHGTLGSLSSVCLWSVGQLPSGLSHLSAHGSHWGADRNFWNSLYKGHGTGILNHLTSFPGNSSATVLALVPRLVLETAALVSLSWLKGQNLPLVKCLAYVYSLALKHSHLPVQ